MSPLKPSPVPPPAPQPDDDIYADMPALICGLCSNIFSKGGHLWETEHPSIDMCQCHHSPMELDSPISGPPSPVLDQWSRDG